MMRACPCCPVVGSGGVVTGQGGLSLLRGGRVEHGLRLAGEALGRRVGRARVAGTPAGEVVPPPAVDGVAPGGLGEGEQESLAAAAAREGEGLVARTGGRRRVAVAV